MAQYIQPRTAITHGQLNNVADALEASVTNVSGDQVSSEGLDETSFSTSTGGYSAPWAGPRQKVTSSTGVARQATGIASLSATVIPSIDTPASDLVLGDYFEVELHGIASVAHYLDAHPPVQGSEPIPQSPLYHYARIILQVSYDDGASWIEIGDPGSAVDGPQVRIGSIVMGAGAGEGYSARTDFPTTGAGHVWPDGTSLFQKLFHQQMMTTTPSGIGAFTNTGPGYRRTFYLNCLVPAYLSPTQPPSGNVKFQVAISAGEYGSADGNAADPFLFIESGLTMKTQLLHTGS